MFVSLRGVVMYVVERLRISCLVLELTVGRRNDRSSIQCFFSKSADYESMHLQPCAFE